MGRRVLRPAVLKTIKAGNFSPRSRTITDEPALNYYLQAAATNYSIRNPEVIMLVPRQIEQHIVTKLRQRKLPLGKISSLRGTYRLSSAGGLLLIINEAMTLRGKMRLNLAIKL